MTIVELLVATTCMLLVMAGVFVIFSSQSKTATFEREIINMQMNSRIAMERLRYILSHAGYGCSDSFQDGESMSGDDPDTGSSVTINSFLWDFNNNNANGTDPDSVVVVYGFRRESYVNGNANSTSIINLTNSTSINTSEDEFKNYINIFPNIEGNNFYKVESIAGSDYTINNTIGMVADRSSVYMVTPVRIKIDNKILQFQNFRYNNSTMWNLTDNIQDLQFKYTLDGLNWVDTPGDPNAVIGIAINLLARSENEDPNYTDVKQYTYQWPDNTTDTVGPFNDGFHRKHSRAQVWLRNTE